jgi:hypothetical protein
MNHPARVWSGEAPGAELVSGVRCGVARIFFTPVPLAAGLLPLWRPVTLRSVFDIRPV